MVYILHNLFIPCTANRDNRAFKSRSTNSVLTQVVNDLQLVNVCSEDVGLKI